LDNDPQPTNYSADDFYPVFDLMFNIPNASVTNLASSFQWQFVSWFNSYTNSYQGTQRLQRLIALPVLLCNNVATGFPPFPDDQGTLAALGTQTFRVLAYEVSTDVEVVIHFYAFLAFMISGFVLLLWSAMLLVICWFNAKLPEQSAFTEMDFASRCLDAPRELDPGSISTLLFAASNTDSKGVMEKCANHKMYCNEDDGDQVRLRLEPQNRI
jgi:hypothetical protein